MYVINNKSGTILVKGAKYKVREISNLNGNKYGMIVLSKFPGKVYSCGNFKTLDGKNLPSIQKNYEEKKHFSLSVKKGDLIKCLSDVYNNYTKGEVYKVKYVSDHGSTYGSNSVYMKIEGFSNSVKATNNFKILTKAEKRKHVIDSMRKDNSTFIKESSGRKIDSVDNKNKKLMEFISKSIVDKNRHYLTILEWAIRKKGNKYEIKKDDYKDLLKMTLGEILKEIE